MRRCSGEVVRWSSEKKCEGDESRREREREGKGFRCVTKSRTRVEGERERESYTVLRQTYLLLDTAEP